MDASVGSVGTVLMKLLNHIQISARSTKKRSTIKMLTPKCQDLQN